MERAWQQWLSCNSSSSPQTTGEGHTWPQNSFRSLKAIKHLLLASTWSSAVPEPQCQGIPKGKAYGLLLLVLKSSFLLFKEIMECMCLSSSFFFFFMNGCLVLKRGSWYKIKTNARSSQVVAYRHGPYSEGKMEEEEGGPYCIPRNYPGASQGTGWEDAVCATPCPATSAG